MKVIPIGRFKPYRFAIFERFPEVHACVSTRHSTVPEPNPVRRRRINLPEEERRERYFRSEKQWYNALHIPVDHIARIHQVHGDHIVHARQPGILGEGDGIVTNLKNLYLRVVTADCLSVFIYDPCAKAIGLVHAGWRGLCNNVIGKTIEKMQKLFNSKPRNLIIAIAPFIQACCYTVKEDVAGKFSSESLGSINNGAYKLDMGNAAGKQLALLKIPHLNIEIASECTYCRDDLFYSARRDKLRTGRNVSIVGLQ
ncbi:hypothetical protein AMJ80_02720 [bacterium SM23_31]|nr:MAG: hypothetical protein AMJ80_02720 [bacterium SM23_31]